MRTIIAIYENGVFRPTVPVNLPEGAEVTVELKPPEGLSPHQKRIRELLRQPVDTNDPGFSSGNTPEERE